MITFHYAEETKEQEKNIKKQIKKWKITWNKNVILNTDEKKW